MASPAQIEANRANAQHSTGPSSPEGKLKCSHNALTGRIILLPTDDVAAYQKLVTLIERQFDPRTDEEKHLVQSIADTEWRILRIPTLEAGIYALGRNELAGECSSESDPQTRASMIEALIFRNYRKDLNNLSIQENRLNRQLDKHKAQLQQLTDDRESLSRVRLEEATMAWRRAKADGQPFDVTQFGSVFTEEYLCARSETLAKRGGDAIAQFDRAWKTKIRSQAA